MPESRFNVEFMQSKLSGDSARFLPIWNPPPEQALLFKTIETIPPQDAEPPYQMNFRRSGKDLLPPAVFLGDSFFWNIFFSGFQHHFSELYFGHLQRPSARDILRQPPVGTRVVIIELLETNFPIGFQIDN
jgi:hypothetical protein